MKIYYVANLCVILFLYSCTNGEKCVQPKGLIEQSVQSGTVIKTQISDTMGNVDSYIIDSIIKFDAILKKENYSDVNFFNVLLKLKNEDSIGNRLTSFGDTVFCIDIAYPEGGWGYSIWNRTDTITHFVNNRKNNILPFSKELLLLIETWDTCEIKNKNKPTMKFYSNNPMYFSSMFIADSVNCYIQTIKHEYFPN